MPGTPRRPLRPHPGEVSPRARALQPPRPLWPRPLSLGVFTNPLVSSRVPDFSWGSWFSRVSGWHLPAEKLLLRKPGLAGKGFAEGRCGRRPPCRPGCRAPPPSSHRAQGLGTLSGRTWEERFWKEEGVLVLPGMSVTPGAPQGPKTTYPLASGIPTACQGLMCCSQPPDLSPGLPHPH